MPVHINDCNRKWDIFFLEFIHQLIVAFFRIFIISAPPVSESKPWKHRCFSAESVKIMKCFFVVMSVSEEVQILDALSSWLDPAVRQKHLRPAVVHQRISEPGKNTMLQLCSSVHHIQRSGSSLQIMDLFSVVPDAVIGT